MTEGALHRAERLASLGTLTAGIAHEINNPVGAALLTAETALSLLQETDARPRVAACLVNIVKSMERCGEIVRNILKFSRDDPAEKGACDLAEVARHVLDYVRPFADGHGCKLVSWLPEAQLKIFANPLEIELILINLVHNAVEATAKQILVKVSPSVDGSQVRVVVADDGKGMSATEQQHVFDPFYTTRITTGGTGLGMSIVYGIVKDHRGEIRIESAPGVGTSVQLEFPGLSAADQTAHPTHNSAQSRAS
jgi:signal transduction histidine kinase